MNMRNDPWAGLSPASAQLVGNRVGGRHALDIYWVKSSRGAPGLLMRGIEPDRIPCSRSKPAGFSLEVEHLPEAVDLRMFVQNPIDREVFHTLCCDVIAYSAAERTASEATESIYRRLMHWHSLMSKARISAMDPHEIRGLIGELCALERLIEVRGFPAALQAWVAPDDHAQDFLLATRILEIKSRLASGRQHVRISSLEQLQSAHLSLALVVVELTRSDVDEAATLNRMCDRLARCAREISQDQEDALQVALLKRGYTRQDVYDADAYLVVGVRAFGISPGFPRIARSDVDARIPSAEYTLDLAHLSEFEVDPKSVMD